MVGGQVGGPVELPISVPAAVAAAASTDDICMNFHNVDTGKDKVSDKLKLKLNDMMNDDGGPFDY